MILDTSAPLAPPQLAENLSESARTSRTDSRLNLRKFARNIGLRTFPLKNKGVKGGELGLIEAQRLDPGIDVLIAVRL